MNLTWKKLSLVALVPTIAIPVAVTQTGIGGTEEELLNQEQTEATRETEEIKQDEEDNSAPIVELTSVQDVISSFESSGYKRKEKDKLTDFNLGRGIYKGNNTGLGCHRLIFGGKNYPKLRNPQRVQGSKYGFIFRPWDPLSIPLACSTASLRDEKGKKLYEFEFAFRQGSEGFIEKIFVEQSKIYSQVVIYKKKETSGSFEHTDALQRHIVRSSKDSWKIANPTSTEPWTDLDLENDNPKEQPIYYAVWTGNNTDQGNILKNLGVKSRGDDKWFSSVVTLDKTQNENTNFEYFTGPGNGTIYLENSFVHSGYESMSLVSQLLEETEGSWKQIEDFCEDYHKNEASQKLTEAEKIRFQEYCYSKTTS